MLSEIAKGNKLIEPYLERFKSHLREASIFAAGGHVECIKYKIWGGFLMLYNGMVLDPIRDRITMKEFLYVKRIHEYSSIEKGKLNDAE